MCCTYFSKILRWSCLASPLPTSELPLSKVCNKYVSKLTCSPANLPIFKDRRTPYPRLTQILTHFPFSFPTLRLSHLSISYYSIFTFFRSIFFALLFHHIPLWHLVPSCDPVRRCYGFIGRQCYLLSQYPPYPHSHPDVPPTSCHTPPISSSLYLFLLQQHHLYLHLLIPTIPPPFLMCIIPFLHPSITRTYSPPRNTSTPS